MLEISHVGISGYQKKGDEVMPCNIFTWIGIITCVVLLIVAYVKIKNYIGNRETRLIERLTSVITRASDQSLKEAVSLLAQAGIHYECASYSRNDCFKIPKCFWSDSYYIYSKAKMFITLVTYYNGRQSQGKIQKDLLLLFIRQIKKTPDPVLYIAFELGRRAKDNPLFKEFFNGHALTR
jgi:hypothetical protein